MIETQPASLDPDIENPGLPVMTARILRRLREANDWQTEICAVLTELGHGLDVHRSILFRLREVPGKGFAQSIAAYWVDDTVESNTEPPTLIVQSIVNNDPLLERLAEEVRQGKIFAGHTRELSGFLRQDFENQKIKSFLSVAVFAHGHVWGTLAVNDCLVEREWTGDEKA